MPAARRHGRFRAFLAGICLLLHALSLAWLPTLFSAALASLDDEHHVDLCWGAAGMGTRIPGRAGRGNPAFRHRCDGRLAGAFPVSRPASG
ncbi:MAG: hypothetical protein ACKO3N_09650, partial [Verrucomicrobiota bacterium]